jgi:hypothetical protein
MILQQDKQLMKYLKEPRLETRIKIFIIKIFENNNIILIKII